MFLVVWCEKEGIGKDFSIVDKFVSFDCPVAARAVYRTVSALDSTYSVSIAGVVASTDYEPVSVGDFENARGEL